jgi:hypothetical protein
MTSWIATLALLLWPFVAAALFSLRPPALATLWTVVGAQLLLPVGEMIKFDMIPQFDKGTIPNLCIFFGFLLTARQTMPAVKRGLADVLVLIYILGPLATSLQNGDIIVVGERVLPGVGVYDAGSAIGSAVIALMPFFVGRQLLRSKQATEQILKVLVIAGLLYSIPLLFEIRFSPQLHLWVYGYYPSDFVQVIRGEGYRPMVFMGHGLIAAIFLFMTVVAAAAFWRTDTRIRQLPAAGVAFYLSVVLILCQSAGAAAFGVFAAPLARFAKPVFQSKVAIVIVLIALSYPILRFIDVVPTRLIVDVVGSLSSDRSSSLGYRFENEDKLLSHALERPVFGWGRYGRARVYDAESGKDISVTDGRWTITLGTFGILGFIAEFGLLGLCVIRASFAQRYIVSAKEKCFLAALALIVSMNILDLLPNASLLPLTWLCAGALLGRAEALRESARHKRRSQPTISTGLAETGPVAGRMS